MTCRTLPMVRSERTITFFSFFLRDDFCFCFGFFVFWLYEQRDDNFFFFCRYARLEAKSSTSRTKKKKKISKVFVHLFSLFSLFMKYNFAQHQPRKKKRQDITWEKKTILITIVDSFFLLFFLNFYFFEVFVVAAC